MLRLQKKNISFHSPIFYLKIHKRQLNFFESGEGANSPKWTYIEGHTCKMNKEKQGGVKN